MVDGTGLIGIWVLNEGHRSDEMLPVARREIVPEGDVSWQETVARSVEIGALERHKPTAVQKNFFDLATRFRLLGTSRDRGAVCAGTQELENDIDLKISDPFSRSRAI